MEEIKTTVEVVDIQFRPGQKIYYFDPAGLHLKAGDHVIIDTARGAEFGICTGGNHHIPERDVIAPLRSVMRIANEQDEKAIADNRNKERMAHDVCLAKIAEHSLQMQLVSTEVAFDGSKILFFFTADERVDFRELVKNLASVFHTRIELRQIGVRDKAKMVGGLGICGRPFCCATFLDDFQPVSIKMAKTQNLSLNPTKISGTCGRLMCCLKYEQDAYEDLLRTAPKQESFVDTPQGRGTVVEVDLLRQRVKVRMEDSPEECVYFRNEDIAILRSGKAKKTDPPIPADLAPISGGGKQPYHGQQSEETPALAPIRFRYREEAVVDEPEIEPELSEAVTEVKKQPRRRKKPVKAPKESPVETSTPPKQPAPTQKQAPAEKKAPSPEKKTVSAEKKAAPPVAKAPEAGEQKPGRPNHRRHYHHRNKSPKQS